MPLICSSTLLGLEYYQPLPAAGMLQKLRVRHRFHRIESSINDELDISRCETGNTLWILLANVSRSNHSHLTSNAVKGVGAPGPPAASP